MHKKAAPLYHTVRQHLTQHFEKSTLDIIIYIEYHVKQSIRTENIIY